MIGDLQIGKWCVSSARREIWAEGEQVQLEPRVMDLLIYLAEHTDEVLSKERLIQAVWPDAFVADDVLTSAIWKLRQALGDDAKNPSYIQTIPRRGYQLICEVIFPDDEREGFLERYCVERKLGEGGMGEVFLARDTELGRLLALKFLKPETEHDELTRRRLRREALAAALLDHPFICKIYDTGNLNGRDFIAMEYIEGEKLSVRLQRGPIPVDETFRIALEILEALEAAHGRGIVHRDIKPSNIILTQQGHIKITDFGIAKRIKRDDLDVDDWTDPKTVTGATGTPTYISPEQIRLEPVDHRTDLFLFGIVLFEMLTGVHPFRKKTKAETAAAILNEHPVSLADFIEGGRDHLAAFDETLSRLLAKRPERRYQLAQHVSIRLKALHEQWVNDQVGPFRPTSRPAKGLRYHVSPEEVGPYPGLSAFSREQAKYFFGREFEVEVVWKKLQFSRLLGLIGPSGGGKSSFLRAGLLPAAPSGWGYVLTTPGNRPFLGLAQALSEELAGDPASIKELLRFEEPTVALKLVSKWRDRYRQALIIIDHFEELFTLNPADVQRDYIRLLGQLEDRAEVHLLLSMRDDFLFHCHGFESLEPVFSNLTPIGPPIGAALKRALMEPAEKCGFRFEDEELAENMLGSVAGEPGALPLLAFAFARWWEQRDIQRKLLTREACEGIGGVEGALAGHAEATLEKIGLEGRPIVRELFRNLVTAQGTRAVQNRSTLLSVFDRETRARASAVLDQLIDARLLVSFRIPSVDREQATECRIQIIHESLLTHWPRLVRWQAEDADGAQLRDELRQAAQVWDQHGRLPDLLWRVTALKEYETWRERYGGALAEPEEAFVAAMTQREHHRSRRRRVLIAAVIALAMIIALTTGTLWQWAVAEARRAEAAHLLSEARLCSETDPTAAVAFATRSLELADSEVTRLLVTRVLSLGPIAYSCETEQDVLNLEFSPDRQFLVGSGHGSLHQIWNSSGSASVRLRAHSGYITSRFSNDSRYMVSSARDGQEQQVIVWRLPELEEVKRFRLNGNTQTLIHPNGILTLSPQERGPQRRGRVLPYEAGSIADLGEWPWMEEGWNTLDIRPGHGEMVNVIDRTETSELRLIKGLPNLATRPTVFAETQGICLRAAFLSDGIRFATYDASRAIQTWDLEHPGEPPLAIRLGPERYMNEWSLDSRDHWLAIANGSDRRTSVWDLTAPVSFGPQILRHGDRATSAVDVDPQGHWLAVGDTTTVSLWPLRRIYPSTLFQTDTFLQGIAFDPKGTWIALSTFAGSLHIWSLETEGDGRRRVLFEPGGILDQMAVSPDGERIAVGQWNGTIHIVPVSGGPITQLTGFQSPHTSIAFDSTGKKLVAAAGFANPSDNQIRIWDLDSGEVQVLHPREPEGIWLQFEDENHLLSSGLTGLRRWHLREAEAELVVPNAVGLLSPNGRFYLAMKKPATMEAGRDLRIFDLELGKDWRLPSHGENLYQLRWHPSSNAIISSSYDGTIRVSDLEGIRTHYLQGHEKRALIQIDPLGRWIASAGKEDGIFRIWPMPDISKSPLHTLPRDELVARLRSITNYSVIEDEGSPNGYRIEFGPLPGWDEPPEW